MSSIKKSLALFVAKRKFFSEKISLQNFNGKVSNANKILIILPNNAEDILKCLDIPAFFKNNSKSVKLVGEDKFKKIVLEEQNYELITFTEESITKLGLPNHELAAKLSELALDLVLDLNREEDLFSSILANIPESAVKIGFKKNQSDIFYNLQIANNQNNAEISYRNFLNSIQMF